MMITKIQLAAMSRVDVKESERRDFYLYVDEFQNFATESFANILSEARKYRLNLIMAHQYIEQLSEEVKPAVFGNVGTLIVFRVGAADAEELVPEFTPTFTEEDIVNLPKYEFYIKLMIDGISSDPFSARGLAPLSEFEKTDNTEKVIKVSRERYAKSKETVEDKIMRWHENSGGVEEEKKKNNNYIKEQPLINPVRNYSAALDPLAKQRGIISDGVKAAKPIFSPKENNRPAANFAQSGAAASGSVYKYDAVCARCGKGTKTSFKPDGVRPVFCKDCLIIAREEKSLEFESRLKQKVKELENLKQPHPIKTEEISLNEAIKKGAVDFKGRVQAPAALRQPKLTDVSKNKEESSLKEGEEINFS
jgi:CxxC-x17-CxxC domain-containing protein